MKILKTFSYVILLAYSFCSNTQELKEINYNYIHEIVGKNLSDSKLVVLVREAISREDSSAVDWVVNLLVELTYLDKLPYSGTEQIYRKRSFTDISNLKKILIDKWVDNYKDSGYNLRLTLIQSLGSTDGRSITLPKSITDGETGKVQDPEMVARLLREQIPAWIKVPIVLSAYWPGDSEVHALIWDYYLKDKSPDVVFQTMRWLNNGMFSTDRDNKLRIDQLVRRDLTDPSEVILVQLAAQGLAYSKPVEAIPFLIEAGLTHPRARNDILFVLAKYGDTELEGHINHLSSMLIIVDEEKLLPLSRAQTSYLRLKSLTNKVKE